MAWIPTARQTAGHGERQRDSCLWRVLQVIAHLIHAHPFPCSLNYNKQRFKRRLVVKVCVLVCFTYSVENQRMTARVCEWRFVYSCVCTCVWVYCVSDVNDCHCVRRHLHSVRGHYHLHCLLRWGDLKRQQAFNCPLSKRVFHSTHLYGRSLRLLVKKKDLRL